MGQYLNPIQQMSAGGLVAIGPVLESVLKTATISSEPDCPSFAPMPLLTTPFVKVSVSAVHVSDTAKLVEGLAALNRADNSVEVYREDNGETILATCGEVHLQRCVKDLEDLYARVPVSVSEPILSFRETVVETARCKSVQDTTPNQRCVVTVKALALPEDFVKFLEANEATIGQLFDYNSKPELQDIQTFKGMFEAALQEMLPNLRALLVEHLLAFGPKRSGPNVLVYQSSIEGLFSRKHADEEPEEETSDSASLASDMSESNLSSALVGGFDLATAHGPLCSEPLRGVCFIIEEVKISGIGSLSDPYGPFHGQVISTTRDACRLAMMKNSPRLIEGVYICSIQAPQDQIGKIYSFLHRRRGTIIEEEPQDSTDTLFIQAYLPVPESFGISDELWRITAGSALPQISFSHWEVMKEDPLEAVRTQEELEEFGTQPALENTPKRYIAKVRRRKGLPTGELLVKHADKQRTLGKNK
jgi:ribosome assembly protein 1